MRRSVTLLLVVGLTLTAACSNGGDGDGGDDDQGTPAERVAAAADRTREDGSARTSFESTVTGLGGGEESGSASGEGLVDFDRSLGSLNVDLAALLGAAGLPGLDAEAETIYEGSVLYLRSDLINGFLGVDTPWIRVDLDDPGDGTGFDLGPLAALAGNDPGAQLGLLAGIAPDSVEEAGEADVRGEGTTLYRATVDLAAAARNAGDEVERQRFEGLITQLGTDQVDVEVNLDGSGRVRRIAYSQPLPAGGGDGGSADVEIEYYDFGAEVDLAVPTAGEVTDLSEVPVPGG